MRRTLAKLRRSDLTFSIAASFGRGFNVVLSVAYGIILARLLAPEGRGQFAVAASIAAIGMQCVTLGFPASITYFASIHPGSLRFLLRRAQGITAAAGLVFALIVLTLRIAVQPKWCSSIDIALLAMACGSMMAASALLIAQGACLAADEAWRFGWSDAIARLLTIIAIFIVASVGVFSPLVALACTVVATGVTTLWLLNTPGLGISSPHAIVPRIGSELHYGLRSAIAGALGAIPVRVLAIAVAARDGDAASGQFAVALSVAETIVGLGGTFAATRMPKMIRVRNHPRERWRELARTLASVSVGSVGCALAIATVARPVLRVAFGDRYTPAAGLLVECLPGAASLAIASVFQHFLAARGLPLLALAAPATSAATTWILIIFAYEGGAISIGAAYAAQGVAFLVTSSISVIWNLRQQSESMPAPLASSSGDTIDP